ncbi:hypothetical protein SEVIR_3G092600v4 [Setaria viridis]|uniref:FAS1 domain-containing protein n=1 Tax=Setaria viridis TaxID=4556 RepID=A0A4U6V971_SETVI|nr:FAS1 domain-containing protein SELMODRAFT_448915-like [Setaria viridis]TKW25072.1 hypothetical protein SEVIR_3G092600v2 [Setaria viridis]
MASTFLATMSLFITHMVSASGATAATVPSPPKVSSDITTTVQEMQRARYFTFVMLVRMVQEKIPRNTTFLMPSDRLMSTASISESQVLEFLSRHSIAAPLKFDDLIKLPNGTVVPTRRHSGDTITVTNSRDQKLYINGIKLTIPDLCHSGKLFRCHGINGVIRPTAAQRVKAACTRTSAAPVIPLAENQSLSTSSLPSPNTGSATLPANEPAAGSSQSSDTSMSKTGLASTTLMIALIFSIF